MIRSLLNRIGTPYAVSLRLWLWSSPIVLLGTAFSFGVDTLFSHPGEMFLLSIAAHLLVGAFSLVAWIAHLHKQPWKRPRPVVVLLIFSFAGLARGLLTSYAASLPEIQADPDFLARAISGVWVHLFWACLLTLTLESSSTYKSSLDDLKVKISDIQNFGALKATQLDALRDDYIRHVTQVLAPALDKVRTSFDLVQLANRFVGPSTLRTLDEKVLAATSLRGELKRLSPGTLIRLALRQKFSPIAIPTLAALGLGFPIVYRAGIAGFVHLAFLATLIALTIRLLSPPRSLGTNTCVFIVSLLISLSLIGSLMVDLRPDPYAVSFTSHTIGIWLISGFLMLLIALDRQRADLMAQFQVATSELNSLESKLRQELFLERRNLDRLVHSEIQGRLRAAAMMVKEVGQGAEMERLKSECISALSGGSQLSLAEFVSETQLLWGKSLEAKFEIAEHAIERMKQDPYLLAAFMAICRESILNAVKHGRARNLFVRATILDSLYLILEVKNDGQFAAPNRHGGGFQIFEEVCESWSLVRDKEQTKLTFRLPVALSLQSF